MNNIRTPTEIEKDIISRNEELQYYKKAFDSGIAVLATQALSSIKKVDYEGQSVSAIIKNASLLLDDEKNILKKAIAITEKNISNAQKKIHEIESEKQKNAEAMKKVYDLAQKVSTVRVQANLEGGEILSVKMRHAKNEFQQAKQSFTSLTSSLEKLTNNKRDFDRNVRDAQRANELTIKKAEKELNVVKREYKAAQDIGAKLLRAEQEKFLKYIVEKGVIDKLQGLDIDIQQIASDYTPKDINFNLFTDQQAAEWNTLRDNLGGSVTVIDGERFFDTTSTLNSTKELFENALKEEITKSAEALKKSDLWKNAENALDNIILPKMPQDKGYFAEKQIKELQQIKKNIQLTLKDDKFEFVLAKGVKEDEKTRDIMNAANSNIRQHGGELSAKFSDVLQNTTKKVQNPFFALIEAISEAIKKFFENKLGTEFDQSLNSTHDLNKKQERGIKNILDRQESQSTSNLTR